MKINLIPRCIYGTIYYEDAQNKIKASKINDKWYPVADTTMFDAGFTNIASMTNFLENFDIYAEDLQFLGYHQEGTSFINYSNPSFKSEVQIKDDGTFEIISYIQFDKGTSRKYKLETTDFEILKDHILQLFEEFPEIDIFASIILAPHEKAQYVIEAKMSSRDLSKNLVRVKSSNIWSYGINIRDRKDKTGDVIVQFKDKNGGPGDLYQYLDVPVTSVWRKWLAAPSKGHFFWEHIRDNYKYRKLTGDKRGKLPNAIN